MAKRKKQFQKSTFKLKKDHTWDAPKGYKVVVLDRGVVSFNVPRKWIVVDTEPFTMHDAEPPHDDARLSVSFWRLPPGVDMSGLPQAELLLKSTQAMEVDVLEQSVPVRVDREDIEIFWMEQRFLDPQEKREAITRITVARGWDVQAVISLDYWVEDAERLLPMWQELVRSLQMGRVIEDPTRGEIRH
jgi:hypothetical protein